MDLQKRNRLEEIRTQLGLNRKQMAELLGVDPSAWTRWTRSEQGAPEMVYRALDWYLQLINKNPEVHEKQIQKNEVKKLKAEIKKLKEQMHHPAASTLETLQLGLPLDWAEEKQSLEQKIEKNEAVGAGWKMLLLINLFALVILILIQFL